MKLVLNINKSVHENAAIYFEKAKKARKKAEGAKKAIDILQKKLEQLEKKKSQEEGKIKRLHKEKRKKEWYEKFRWFFSSEGYLVIGGRDATTNEILIKKYTEKNDLVFHTDMLGSPFFVIKKESNPDKEITEKTIKEAASATFIFSRAFSSGYYTTKVFYVSPSQVTKEAKSGEYLTKGSFVIKGKTNYVEPDDKLAIGVFNNLIMCGPLDAIKANCKNYVELKRGQKKPSEIAHYLKKIFDIEIDEIIRALPATKLEIIEKTFPRKNQK